MDRTHSECFKYASENDYVLVRYAQGDWQTRDPELILYLDVPGKPRLVGVGLTERAVSYLRQQLNLDREIQEMTTAVSRAGAIMRFAAGRDDIPCSAFVPAADASELQANLRWNECVAHPEVLNTLVDIPVGLLPTCSADHSRMTLISKTTREMAETARVRGSLSVYLVPLRASDVHTRGLVTAFFDDHDEPLTIRTLLFDEEDTRFLLQVLSSVSFDMHCIDEHNRNLISFRADNKDAARFRSLVETIRLVPESLELARQFHDDMVAWFGTRSTEDDNAAFRIDLLDTVLPDNLHPQNENPGDFNERDIEMGLHRAFIRDQVCRNPMRADTGREFVDVLAATENTVLLIQAKDSPINESTLSRTIDRKMSVAAKHVTKAADQLKGSINHLRSSSSIEIIIDGQRREISMSSREVFGLVVVKELFDQDRSALSRLVLSVYDETGVPCLLMDYLEFQQLTFFRRTEESFMDALRDIYSAARKHGLFPRSRFGLVEDGPIVYSPTGPASNG